MVERPVSENSRKGLQLVERFPCGEQDHIEKAKRPHRSQEINSQPGTQGTSCRLKRRARKKFPAQVSGSACPCEQRARKNFQSRKHLSYKKSLRRKPSLGVYTQTPEARNLCFLCCNGPSQSTGAGGPRSVGSEDRGFQHVRLGSQAGGPGVP